MVGASEAKETMEFKLKSDNQRIAPRPRGGGELMQVPEAGTNLGSRHQGY